MLFVLEIEGFLKFSIKDVTMPGGTIISQGCLADKELNHKIELRFRSVVNSTFTIGTHIAVRGKIISNTGKLPYLIVNSIGDVRLLSDLVKTSKQMLRANVAPNVPNNLAPEPAAA